MGSIFRADSKLVQFLNKITNLIIVSILWCLCCLPVITIVPASAAMFHTTEQVIQKTGNGVLRDFFHTFRQELKQGICLSVVEVFSLIILAGCICFGWWNHATALGLFYLSLGLVLSLVWICAALHIPMVLSEFDGELTVILRLSFYMASFRLLQSVAAVILIMFLVLAVFFCPILLFLAPGLYMDLSCSSLRNGLNRVASALNIEEPQIADTQQEKEMEKTGDVDPIFSALEQAKLFEQQETY